MEKNNMWASLHSISLGVRWCLCTEIFLWKMLDDLIERNTVRHIVTLDQIQLILFEHVFHENTAIRDTFVTSSSVIVSKLFFRVANRSAIARSCMHIPSTEYKQRVWDASEEGIKGMSTSKDGCCSHWLKSDARLKRLSKNLTCGFASRGCHESWALAASRTKQEELMTQNELTTTPYDRRITVNGTKMHFGAKFRRFVP